MFEYLQGRVEELQPGAAVVSTGGIGWLLQVSSRTAARLQVGREARLAVHLLPSESAITLYGFHDGRERALFRRLLAVAGIGPALALSALSAFEPDEFVGAILDRDVSRLSQVKGVGRRKAERLVVELQDRLAELAPAAREPGAATSLEDLSRVLQDLGFRPREARKSAASAREALGDGASLEEMLRAALQGAREQEATEPA